MEQFHFYEKKVEEGIFRWGTRIRNRWVTSVWNYVGRDESARDDTMDRVPPAILN